jgi:hypothetical protein
MALVVAGIQVARVKANEAVASNMVGVISSGLDNFYQDHSYYPGAQVDPDQNAFPELFEALLGEKPPKGKAGKSAPYVDVKEKDVVVEDPLDGSWREPTFDERYDPSVPKYIRDPWGNPYWYRVNKSKPRAPWMKRPEKCDIWSMGNDKTNSTIPGAEPLEDEDDLGNW